MSVVDIDRDERRSVALDALPDDGPTLAEIHDDSPRMPLPSTYRCYDPWPPCSGLPVPHLHGVRPDGVRV